MIKILLRIKLLHSETLNLILCIIIGICLVPSLLCADQATHTYDRQSIRYPSMDTGQVWAKIGGTSSTTPKRDTGQTWKEAGDYSSSNLKMDAGKTGAALGENASPDLTKDTGQIHTMSGENSSPTLIQGSQIKRNQYAPDSEIKKRLKARRHKTLRSLENGNNQKASIHKSSLLEIRDEENQKTSTDKPVHPKKIPPPERTVFETQKTNQPVKNWHHKHALYDVECGLKMARIVVTYYFDKRDTLLSSNISPDAQWYHIYPGSFEEKLYEDICHPR
jgi:hypothetical protein